MAYPLSSEYMVDFCLHVDLVILVLDLMSLYLVLPTAAFHQVTCSPEIRWPGQTHPFCRTSLWSLHWNCLLEIEVR